MVRIQYKQIERIAQQCNVTATRGFWPGEVDSPAVRLSGFLSGVRNLPCWQYIGYQGRITSKVAVPAVYIS